MHNLPFISVYENAEKKQKTIQTKTKKLMKWKEIYENGGKKTQ